MYKQNHRVMGYRPIIQNKNKEEEKKEEEQKKQIGRELIKQDVKKQFQANPKH